MGAPSVQMKRAERAVEGARKKLCGRLPSDRGFREVGELEEQVVGLVASLRDARHEPAFPPIVQSNPCQLNPTLLASVFG